MRNLTYGALKATLARAIGTCSTDAALLDLVNEAQERLLNRTNDPVGSVVRYRFCSNESCLVLPRQVRTVLRFLVCDSPGDVMPEWYEMITNGPGQQDEDNMPGIRMIDHGTVVAFNEVNGTGKKIRVYAENAADVGKTITLRYYRDDTRGKFYSSIGGVVQEGEEITMVAPPAYAVTSEDVMQGGLYGVVKETTDYPVVLYEYDGATNTQVLARYEPSETNPIYRNYFLPGLANMSDCEDAASADCNQKAVTVLVKLQHVPVVVDNDPLVIGNVAALKLMSMAIKREEENRYDEATILEAKAIRELEGELASYQGAGMMVPLHVADRDTFGAGGVPEIVSTWLNL